MAVLAAGTTIGGVDVVAELRRLGAGGVSGGGGASSTASADRADVAIKLMTARTIRVNLASSSAVPFDGTANITPGITGILPKANGGTGNNAGIAEYAKSLAQSCVLGVLLNSNAMANFDGTTGVLFGCTGVLPIEKGGTGQSGMEGTDYNTIRYRGIAFVQGTPAVGPVNGGMIFTYV